MSPVKKYACFEGLSNENDLQRYRTQYFSRILEFQHSSFAMNSMPCLKKRSKRSVSRMNSESSWSVSSWMATTSIYFNKSAPLLAFRSPTNALLVIVTLSLGGAVRYYLLDSLPWPFSNSGHYILRVSVGGADSERLLLCRLRG